MELISTLLSVKVVSTIFVFLTIIWFMTAVPVTSTLALNAPSTKSILTIYSVNAVQPGQVTMFKVELNTSFSSSLFS